MSTVTISCMKQKARPPVGKEETRGIRARESLARKLAIIASLRQITIPDFLEIHLAPIVDQEYRKALKEASVCPRKNRA